MEVLWSNCFWMASKILPMLQHLRWCFSGKEGCWVVGGCTREGWGGWKNIGLVFFSTKMRGMVGLIDINDFSCRLEETKRNMAGSTTYSYLFCELW